MKKITAILAAAIAATALVAQAGTLGMMHDGQMGNAMQQGMMGGNMSSDHMHAPAGHGMMDEGMQNGGIETGLGQPSDASKVTQTIDIVMNDQMRFEPDTIRIKAGDTVRFFLRNEGETAHDMIIGSMDELKSHAEMMRQMTGMQHANMMTIDPGQHGGMIWQFDKPGSVDFACLVPGHLDAGMVGKIIVE
jgi:uncharacterized cupredoxin-like copper-binding protein